jgi:phosphoribosyl-dephospho-CoA transferase
MKPLVLSPNTCTKIADNKAAALARRAAVEASRKCAICTQAVDSSKADLEPEGHSREVTVAVAGGVKKENKLKKAVDSLKIDFEDKAIKITEDGSKKKKRLTKTRKVLDM